MRRGKNNRKADVLVVVSLFLQTHVELASSLSAQYRRSILRPWGEGPVLGWCHEQRHLEEDLLGISICFGEKEATDEGSTTTVLDLVLPDLGEDGGLSTQLWPSSIAASILFQSPSFQEYLSDKHILELGSGLGLAGLAAGSGNAHSCILSDMDQETVDFLEKTAKLNDEVLNPDKFKSKVLDWRDSHEEAEPVDLIIGADIAYYFYLLRPIMDTIQAYQSKNNKNLALVLGQANRESQWDLYKNIRDGCYNQLTDEQEPPWPGTTKMLLYKLEMTRWVENLDDFESSSDGSIPIGLIVHHNEGIDFPKFTTYDHVATEEDDESMMKTF